MVNPCQQRRPVREGYASLWLRGFDRVWRHDLFSAYERSRRFQRTGYGPVSRNQGDTILGMQSVVSEKYIQGSNRLPSSTVQWPSLDDLRAVLFSTPHDLSCVCHSQSLQDGLIGWPHFYVAATLPDIAVSHNGRVRHGPLPRRDSALARRIRDMGSSWILKVGRSSKHTNKVCRRSVVCPKSSGSQVGLLRTSSRTECMSFPWAHNNTFGAPINQRGIC